MEEPRRLVRQDRLQKFVRLLSGRYYLKLHLPEEKNAMFQKTRDTPAYYGFCDTKSNIYVHPKISKDPYENLIQQKAVSLHELGHVLYTDGDMWMKSGVSHTLCNIVEDGRVEEAMSRNYSKARKYFFYLYDKVAQPRSLAFKPLKVQTLEFLLRTAKSTTGIPPLPENVKKKLKKKLKDDYYWLGAKTRKAVFAGGEQEAIMITKEIEDKLVKLFGKDGKKPHFPSVSRTPHKSISSKQKQKGAPRPMPPQRNDPLADKILEHEQQELDPKKQKENEKQQKQDKSQANDIQKEMEDQAKKELDKEASAGIVDNKSKDKDKKVSSKDERKKTAKQIYDELKKEAKKEIEKEIKKEYQAETKEVQTGKSKADFNSYNIESKRKLPKGEPIHVAPLDPIARKITHTFKLIAQKGRGWQNNQMRGKIDGNHLYRVVTTKNDPRIFKQQKPKQKTDISAAILLDVSSSMSNCALTAMKTTYVIARALELGEFNVEIIIFGTKDGKYDKNLYGLKSFNQSLTYTKQRFVPRAIDGTPLYPGLVGAQKSLKNVSSKRKIIVVITDGEPNIGGSPYECKQKIQEIEKEGISVIGILIDTHDNNNLFLPTNRLVCRDVYELPNKMRDIIKNVLLTIKR